jgi:hypothetical protein
MVEAMYDAGGTTTVGPKFIFAVVPRAEEMEATLLRGEYVVSAIVTKGKV